MTWRNGPQSHWGNLGNLANEFPTAYPALVEGCCSGPFPPKSPWKGSGLGISTFSKCKYVLSDEYWLCRRPSTLQSSQIYLCPKWRPLSFVTDSCRWWLVPVSPERTSSRKMSGTSNMVSYCSWSWDGNWYLAFFFFIIYSVVSYPGPAFLLS